jgi:hypothetical protein
MEPMIRKRRNKAEMAELRQHIYDIVKANQPMTVRQVFYQLVAKSIVEKLEKNYNNVAVRLLLQLRRNGRIPYAWISDNTRWMHKPRSFDSLEEALEDAAATYRRAVWRELPVYVEIWIEKEALAGVAMEETEPYDVPLMVARGFSSETYIYNAAETIRAPRARPTSTTLGIMIRPGLQLLRILSASCVSSRPMPRFTSSGWQ